MLGGGYHLAPERANGSQPVSPTSEVYAFGCVVHELLLSTSPFEGAGTTDADIDRARTEPWLHDPVRPLVDPKLCRLPPILLHPRIVELLRNTLQPDPARRPAIAEWYSTLRRVLCHDRLAFCAHAGCGKPFMLHHALKACPHCGVKVERKVLTPLGAVIDVDGVVALGRAHCGSPSVSSHHVTLERSGPDVWITAVSTNSPTWVDQADVGAANAVWKPLKPGAKQLVKPGSLFWMHDQPFVVE